MREPQALSPLTPIRFKELLHLAAVEAPLPVLKGLAL